MNERWRQIEEIFYRAVDLQGAEREAFLDEACGADSGLRDEVQSLVEQCDLPMELLDQPILDAKHAHDLFSTLLRENQTTHVAFDATDPATPSDSTQKPTPPTLPAGTLVDDRYRIDALVGQGGMGMVYRATQLNLGRPVALKLMRGELSVSPGSIEQFRSEALAVARLRHPHIVTIHDVGFAPDTGAYIVMELLEGESLLDLIRREGRLTPDNAIRLMLQICAAVHAAHQAGVLHRDLKPPNILIESTSGGPWVKVVDFGIAELISAHPSVEVAGPRRIVGTPHFMSPEQCNGEPTDGRSDVYALGCVLYQMLTGHPPFSATRQNPAAVLDAHRRERPKPPSMDCPDIPAILDSAVLRALAKHPSDRFQSAAELASALGAILDMPRHNLPRTVTSFVGDRALVSELRDRLHAVRLVTFAGPGGIGKTRMSLEVAFESLDLYPGGVWLVELEAVTDPSLVAQAIARALQIREEPGEPIEETVVAALRTKTLLLILDNCEHVVRAVASVVNAALRTAPGLRVLATSREALGAHGETVWHVPSLQVPSADDDDPESLAACSAVRLFVERARRSQPDFRLTKRNARAVSTLATQLEGLPLAIELAAARMRVLTVEQILARMSDRFRLLARSGSTAENRQRALRTTIDWSHDLLTDAERALFRRLSIFVGGCRVDAVERVCTGGDIDSRRILDLIEQLVDKSLVLAHHDNDSARYWMLETIRQYAMEKLASSPDAGPIADAHLDWVLALTAAGDEGLRGPDRANWLDHFESDHENIRAALSRARSEGSHDALLRLAVNTSYFWRLHGYFAEGRSWIEAAMVHADGADLALCERAFNLAGVFAYYQGELEAASEYLERSVALCRALGQTSNAAQRLYNLGAVRNALADYDRAMDLYDESLALFREFDDVAGQARAINGMGLLAMDSGDFARADGLFRESLDRARAGNDPRSIASALHNLGTLARRQRNLDDAEPLLAEALAIALDLDDRHLAANCRYGLGTVELDRQNPAKARDLLLKALDAHSELGARDGIAITIEAFACLAAVDGDARRALTLTGAAERLREAIVFPMHPSERDLFDGYISLAWERLGLVEAEVAFEHGRMLSLDAILDQIRHP